MTDLLIIENLGKRFGGFVALENISLSVTPGERLGLIGPNGSGKSTLVNCICGTLRNERCISTAAPSTALRPTNGHISDWLAAFNCHGRF
jgi:ABC-type branched-subunit amino acid transport system ATPase component